MAPPALENPRTAVEPPSAPTYSSVFKCFADGVARGKLDCRVAPSVVILVRAQASEASRRIVKRRGVASRRFPPSPSKSGVFSPHPPSSLFSRAHLRYAKKRRCVTLEIGAHLRERATESGRASYGPSRRVVRGAVRPTSRDRAVADRPRIIVRQSPHPQRKWGRSATTSPSTCWRP